MGRNRANSRAEKNHTLARRHGLPPPGQVVILDGSRLPVTLRVSRSHLTVTHHCHALRPASRRAIIAIVKPAKQSRPAGFTVAIPPQPRAFRPSKGTPPHGKEIHPHRSAHQQSRRSRRHRFGPQQLRRRRHVEPRRNPSRQLPRHHRPGDRRRLYLSRRFGG